MRYPTPLEGLFALLAMITLANKANGRVPSGPEAEVAQGEQAFARGNFEEACVHWEAAAARFRQKKDPEGEVDALSREAAACQALGRHKLAMERLTSAGEVAEKAKDRRLLAQLQAARGAMCIFAREADQAETLLRESLKAAQQQHDEDLQATVQNDLGILLAAQGKHGEAMAAFSQSITLARRLHAAGLLAKAQKNRADAALASKDYALAARAAEEAAHAAQALPESHDQAFLLMGAAQLWQKLFVAAPEHDNALRARAFHLDEQAQHIAEKLGDDHALSFALGYQGALFEFEKRDPEALALTRRATFYAQRARLPDALYRWQWQAGRLLARQGERDAAVQAYRRAVATLQSIRNDVAIRHGNRNAQSSFREAVGAIYFELADLLLQRADAAKDTGEIQTLLREARDSAELLKAAELEDYFQDDCVNLLKAKTKKVENISPTALVIYILPLPTRTELLVSLPGGSLQRFKAEISGEALTETVRLFRLNLEDRTTEAYLEQARELYAWLIKPLEPLLASSGFQTLVFVPDGALRTIPMSALNDGQKFLVEKYAIAVTPGLELMEARPVGRTPARLMIGGLSQSVEGFAPLTNVPEEMAKIGQLYQRRDEMMNQTFLHQTVGDKMSTEQFTIVHLASHGHFDSDIRKSFVLAYDQHLTLDDLERYIRPGQLRDQPLELLTLSACQTAAGDDRAALGLAGIAVKAGARSAFATLWCVNDAASSQLVSDFYVELTSHPERNKAQALQAAQRKLLLQPRFEHPCYWAPYLIIGNWL